MSAPVHLPHGSLGRVVVVDDSPVQRRFVRAALEPGFEVVGEAHTGREAVAMVKRLSPTVVLMDLDMPGMNGLDAIEEIMATHPTPIVVFSGFVENGDRKNGLACLAAGAVDIMPKPRPESGVSPAALQDDLLQRLRVASRARVIRHPRGRLRPGVVDLPSRVRSEAREGTPGGTRGRAHEGISLVVIGASTGGPQALRTLLGPLPADLQAAVVVVQHMADGFIPGLAAWLDDMIDLPVRVAESGEKLEPGTVSFAPGGGNLHLRDRHLRVQCAKPPLDQYYVPGIDATMTSVAEVLGPAALGVLLTGMGRDGALGLRAMRDRGAVTIGQDEASSAVYGMPAAALELGGVDRQLALADMPAEIVALLTESDPLVETPAQVPS